ncbi:MAG: hypothetical protein DRI69_01895 [Bacteroidetes bacterium]|nr:MAG: hypothetical protein DRI69_01895 [Bacteroidota bacterium]
MRIKALEDWDYLPEFGGNRKEKKEYQTVYRFRVLSGKEDLNLRRDGKDTFPESLEHVIVSVENPPVIVSPSGNERGVTTVEISTLPELKGLYLELLLEYGNHSNLDAKSEKP